MARTAEAYAALRADLELALEHVLSQYEDLERTLRRAVPAVDTLKAGHRRFVADLDELARSL